MLKKVTCGFLLLATMSFGVALADNSPTLDQVYQAARAGKVDDAQRMMDQVLKEHPNSAKAHFVEAELSAKQGQMGRAQSELGTAERLKPDLSFANSQAIQDLRNRITATPHVIQNVPISHPVEQSSSFPWAMLLLGIGVIAIIVLVMRAMNARNPANFPTNYQPGRPMPPNSPMPMQPYGGNPYGGGMGGGMAPMGPAGGGIGSGIMGGLATGAAVGVGMVAGEALAHHFMDGGHNEASNTAPVADSWGNSSNNNMGGSDFGVADNSSWDDSSSNYADSSSDSSGGDWG